MKFDDYLKSIGKTPHAYAKEHGLSVATTWRAANGRSTPDLSFIVFVRDESKGAVAVEDWLDAA